jgi:hypothetical protein
MVFHEVHAAGSESNRAARIAEAAQAIRETIAVQQMPYDRAIIDRYLADARAETGEAAWKSAWNQGRAMPLDDAIDDGLGGT